MNFCFVSKNLLKFGFRLYVNITDRNRVKVMSIPVLFCGLVFKDILVH